MDLPKSMTLWLLNIKGIACQHILIKNRAGAVNAVIMLLKPSAQALGVTYVSKVMHDKSPLGLN